MRLPLQTLYELLGWSAANTRLVSTRKRTLLYIPLLQQVAALRVGSLAPPEHLRPGHLILTSHHPFLAHNPLTLDAGQLLQSAHLFVRDGCTGAQLVYEVLQDRDLGILPRTVVLGGFALPEEVDGCGGEQRRVDDVGEVFGNGHPH